MAKFLFAAHDTGGANMLAPVIALARRRGHDVSLLAAGPALTLWRGLGALLTEAPSAAADLHRELGSLDPDLVATGTSLVVGLERAAWAAARRQGIPSVAAVDSWVNFRRRCVTGDGREVQPDVFCVIDDWCEAQIAAEGWCRAHLYVTGQPHLESLVRRLTPIRAQRTPNRVPLVVFFSEPLREDHAGARNCSYDEFAVAAALLTALADSGPLRLVIQPHPREDPAPWREWLEAQIVPNSVAVNIGGNTETLLLEAHAIAGMATMALIEAALLGIPTVALQPGRTRSPNPRIDCWPGIELVTEQCAIGPAVHRLLSRRGDTPAGAVPLPPEICHADRRLLAVLEREVRGAAGASIVI